METTKSRKDAITNDLDDAARYSKVPESEILDAIENISEGIAVYDASERFVYCNQRYLRIRGDMADQYKSGKTFEEILRISAARRTSSIENVEPRDVEEWIQNRLRRFRNPGPPELRHYKDGRWELIQTHQASNGGRIIIRTDVTENKNSEAEVNRLNAELEQRVRDRTASLEKEIADRVRAETELELARSQLTDAIEAISDGFILFDADDRLVRANAKYREIYKSLADVAVPGMKYADLMRIQNQRLRFAAAEGREDEWLAERIELHRNPREARELEFNDGRWIRHAEFKTSSGGIVGIRTDITELKHREFELSEAQRIGGIGHWRWNARTGELQASDELFRIFGVLPGSTRSLDLITESIHEEDRARERDDRERAMIEKRGYDFAFRIRRSDGDIRNIEGRTTPEFDSEGETVGFFGIAQDVTERHRTEEILRQAQKMESLGQLTGGVAHDFNNLLAIIQGNIAILDTKLGPNSPLRSLTAPALRAIKRGASLTQRLLAFSRRQTLDVTSVDVGALLSGFSEMLARSLGEDIALQIEIAPDLGSCEIDPGQLEQAIVNLANNARDAMPDGGTLIILVSNCSVVADDAAAQAGVKPGAYIEVAVTDTGLGISPENRERIFDPFFTTKDVGQGSGLGLSMVLGFVEQSGGHVTVFSETGKGSTVRLYLPPSETSAPRDEAEESDELPVTFASTVLVVEDDDDLRTMALMILSNLGYRILEARTGREALSHFEASRPVDLILTDVVLPDGMNGPEMVRTAQRSNGPLKVVYMSGYAGDALGDRGMIEDGASFIRKPFSPADLGRQIAEALGRS